MIGLISDELKECWIQTYTGIKFYPFAPRVEDINLVDIAHSLSNICRFGGHSRFFYTVAQHSWQVGRCCSMENRLWGLLHDASEAYCQDLMRPIKRAMGPGVYAQAEAQLQLAIAEAFDLPATIPDEVHFFDNVVLRTEQRDVMTGPSGIMLDWHWDEPMEPLTAKIIEWPQNMIRTYYQDELRKAFDYHHARLSQREAVRQQMGVIS